MKEKKVEEIIVDVTVKGTRPLLQNDSFGEDGGSSKKGQIYDPEEESGKRLIKDEKGKICQKATHFEGCLIKSAAEFKFKGHKTYKELFKAGVFVEPLLIKHKIPKYEIDTQQVKIGTARIIRHRPRLDNWELDFTLKILDDRIDALIAEEVLENAGKYVGVGDYRPKFGLFEVTKFVKRNGKKKLKRG